MEACRPEAVVGLVLDHLSQASLGAVDEDGGVDAGGTYFLLSTRQFGARIGVGNRVGGTLNANAGQLDSQITGTVNPMLDEPMKCLRLVSYRTLKRRSRRYHSPST